MPPRQHGRKVAHCDCCDHGYGARLHHHAQTVPVLQMAQLVRQHTYDRVRSVTEQLVERIGDDDLAGRQRKGIRTQRPSAIA
ncbi:MAG: hypothetical protein M3Y32_03260 [Pseudomonadota bacterium]|nr:hypothetical protein [Pseudomonadota bacterium]